MNFRYDHIGIAVGALVYLVGLFFTGWEYREGISDVITIVGFLTMLIVAMGLHARHDAKHEADRER